MRYPLASIDLITFTHRLIQTPYLLSLLSPNVYLAFRDDCADPAYFNECAEADRIETLIYLTLLSTTCAQPYANHA